VFRLPIWQNPDFIRSYESETLPCDNAALERARRALRDALGRRGLDIERDFVPPALAHRGGTK
jgi:hypothetical protein